MVKSHWWQWAYHHNDNCWSSEGNDPLDFILTYEPIIEKPYEEILEVLYRDHKLVAGDDDLGISIQMEE